MEPEERPTAAELLGKTQGLECRKCGCRDFRTYYTRQKPGYVLRVRICRHCGVKMRTVEK